MPLLMEYPVTPNLIPDLSGEEVLHGSDLESCKVKGVMFGGRKAFLLEQFGEKGYYDSLVGLSPKTLNYARNPAAGMWCEFAAIVEYDKAIHSRWKARFPHILALLGAASAELGIGTIYKALDTKELFRFLERIVLFHEKYQKFGRLSFVARERGATMTYSDYDVCHSPVFCASGVGFFSEAILRHGGTHPRVQETRCTCRGDDACEYQLEWR